MHSPPPAAPLVALLLLVACEPAPATPPAARPASSPIPAVTPPTAAVVMPGELKVFGDWAVGCDNTRLCQMASLLANDGLPGSATMALLRQPGGVGEVDLSFNVIGDAPPVSATAVAIDGRRTSLAALNGSAAMAVARAMAGGHTLSVLDGSRVRTRLSLTGASAAFRWIDAQQGRAGTVTALVARGSRGADTVPAAGPAPVIHAAIATATAASPTAAQLASMHRQAGCDRAATNGTYGAPEYHGLGGGATLVVLPCSAGAYNLSSALFVLRDGRMAPAQTDAPIGFDASGAAGTDRLPSVVNGRWQDGELTSDAKGRGLGDCGVHQTFVWDGTRLRLSEQSEMRECRGNPDFITTWRAQVVRG